MNSATSVTHPPFSLKGRRVWVAGHRGMVGSAIVRRLATEDCEILTTPRSTLDLRNQAQVDRFLINEKPDAIFLAAAKVGGILANSQRPAEFLYDNLVIETNVINAAYTSGVEKLLFLGSSCIYPKFAQQPISETELLTGKLEPTNEAYAIAKIAGLKLCEAYRTQYGVRFVSCMPTNLYGPHDNFDLKTSHVLPALLAKVHEAKIKKAPTVEIWGSGSPRREFLHVDDLADATIHLMKHHETSIPLNLGTGEDVTILELAETIKNVVGYDGKFVFDSSKPDGTPRKLLDVTNTTQLGWKYRINLREGIGSTYEWFKAHACTA